MNETISIFKPKLWILGNHKYASKNKVSTQLLTLRKPSQSLVVRVSPAHLWVLAARIGFRVAAKQLADLRVEVGVLLEVGLVELLRERFTGW